VQQVIWAPERRCELAAVVWRVLLELAGALRFCWTRKIAWALAACSAIDCLSAPCPL